MTDEKNTDDASQEEKTESVTEETPIAAPQSTKKSGSNIAVILTIILIVVAAVGYFVANSGIDKVAVEKKLDQFSANLEKQGEPSANRLTFEYSDVRMEGGFTSRHAIIEDPKFEVLSKEEGVLLTISTSEVTIVPKSAAFDAFDVTIETPVYFDGEEHEVLEFSEPMVTHLQRRDYEGQSAWRVQKDFPKFMVVSEKDEEERIKITYAENPKSVFLVTEDGALIEGELSLENIAFTLEGADEAHADIAAINVDIDQTTEGKDAYPHQVAIDALFEAVEVRGEDPIGPASLALSLTRSGAMPTSFALDDIFKSPNYAIELNELSFTHPQSSLKATANFGAKDNELLPAGEAAFDVKNFGYIRDQLEFDEDQQSLALLNVLMQKTIGQGYYDAQDFTLNVSRTSDGPFKIGNAAFEELLMLFLAGGDLPVPEKPVELDDVIVPEAPPEAIEESAEETEEKAESAIEKTITEIVEEDSTETELEEAIEDVQETLDEAEEVLEDVKEALEDTEETFNNKVE